MFDLCPRLHLEAAGQPSAGKNLMFERQTGGLGVCLTAQVSHLTWV